MSVLARPISVTSTPRPVTPSANAAASSGDESRMSCPIDDPVGGHPALLGDQQLRERGADVADEGGVELLTDETPHVVGLDHLADHPGARGVRGLGTRLSWR